MPWDGRTWPIAGVRLPAGSGPVPEVLLTPTYPDPKVRTTRGHKGHVRATAPSPIRLSVSLLLGPGKPSSACRRQAWTISQTRRHLPRSNTSSVRIAPSMSIQSGMCLGCWGSIVARAVATVSGPSPPE